MKNPLVIANWKMNKTNKEASDFFNKLKENEESISDVEVVICPSFVAIRELNALKENSKIKIGAQNINKEEKGAFTGEVSVAMIDPFCDYVILGHSERRKYFNETYSNVKQKTILALNHQIKPIICVGENLEERGKDLTEYIIRKQLEIVLESLSKEIAREIVIAYEPVWAIGTGVADQPEETNLVCSQIKKFFTELFDSETAKNIRILYGGSVTVNNIASFIQMPGINGALIGGTSLEFEPFLEVVKIIKENNK